VYLYGKEEYFQRGWTKPVCPNIAKSKAWLETDFYRNKKNQLSNPPRNLAELYVRPKTWKRCHGLYMAFLDEIKIILHSQ